MLNSKFDINSPEWIERVFENRNKSYGAYDLRKHYAGNLLRSLCITIFSLAAIVGGASYLMGKEPASVNVNKGVVNVTEKPVRMASDKAAQKAAKRQVEATVGGDSHSGALDNTDVDIKPMPVGGAAAWANFLENNLHYPAEARELRISGKVWVSFIVERDGRISNIVVDKPAGHGFDEEATRVLNLSPVWSPGKQSGQSVRVKYSLPINFNIQHR
jgi:protein TonB